MKSRLLWIPCVWVLGMTAAQADIVTFTGDTTDAPTYNRPLENRSALSDVGTAVHYRSFRFSVDVSGDYTFVTTAPSFDSFVFLYRAPQPDPAFVGDIPLDANDDLFGTTTSGFAHTLIAGSLYAYVNTAYGNDDVGKFSTTIGGPGLISQVPDPPSLWQMFAGMVALSMTRRKQGAAHRN